ncbi:MAG: helix-turn-helix domain-containing protein [Armatimonadetes bacterium]|jgi:transcriptional regulator with XRE-family HTH domain|nr:helix-turn-helix domain-containing protein [Armatimonadota bacterium]
MRLGERFRILRKEKGLPALVLARRAGVSQQTVWLIERWDIAPDSMRAREALARELGVSYEELWGEREQQAQQGGESQP